MELIAPVGNHAMLIAAIGAGADAVYLGIKGVNMRDSAANFEIRELSEVVKKAHANNVKVYLTVNTIVFEHELAKIKHILLTAKRAKVDAIIAWDLAVIKLASESGLKVHLSTQASVSNSVAINEYKKFGVEKVVLARECTLNEIKSISKQTDVIIEAFAHGAMCVAESGRCFLSQFLYGKSANRGKCIQPCRREYIIEDVETKKQLKLENNFILSAKDLCTIQFIDKLKSAGIGALKIEGRSRSPEYVKTVVGVYRKAMDYLEDGEFDKHKDELENKLKEVYNRGFSEGFYMGRPIEEFWNQPGGQSGYRKEYVGQILNYFQKAKAFHAVVHTGKLVAGDVLFIIGDTTGVVEITLDEIKKEGKTFTAPCEIRLRKGDKLYKRIKNN